MPVFVPARSSPVAVRGASAHTWLPLYMPCPVPVRTSVSPRSVLLQTERPLVATYSRGIAFSVRSLELDAGNLDDLRPFREVAPDDRRHLRGRAGRGVDARLSVSLPEVGIGERFRGFGQE